MTALVTDNLPLVSDAPNGIAKLRELILVLAVHGKLVSQDPSDEAAIELLKRTAHARAQRPRRGKTQARPQAPDASKDWPYAVPSGWQWCRLADLVDVLNGRAYKKEELLDAGTPVLRVGNLFTSNHWYYSDLELDDDRYCVPGDLLYAWSASFGPFIWSGDRAIYHYHIWKLESHSDADVNKRYLYSFLTEQTQAIKAAGHGVSMTHMTKEKMERIAVPLPPLAEQARIVAKVDELMALCDRLEAEQADAETAHAQLVQALLASLTQARDAADFRANWQQLTEHFHTLFTTEASIDALKQVVLQLGVMGKLVPQLSSDEPASALLDRATQARQLQAKPGRSAKPSQASEVSNAEMLFDLPAGWVWTRKANVLHFLNGYAFKSEWFKPEGTRLLRNVNVGHGSIDWKECASIPSDQAAEFSEFELQVNDLVLTLDRPIISTGLKAAIVKETDLPCLLLQRVAKISSFADCIATSYLFIWLNSRFFTGSINPGRSNGVPHISTTQVAKMAFALPPLAEQHRIVAKVDELLALCDQLKLDLTQARQHHTHLASVLVDQAVAA